MNGWQQFGIAAAFIVGSSLFIAFLAWAMNGGTWEDPPGTPIHDVEDMSPDCDCFYCQRHPWEELAHWEMVAARREWSNQRYLEQRKHEILIDSTDEFMFARVRFYTDEGTFTGEVFDYAEVPDFESVEEFWVLVDGTDEKVLVHRDNMFVIDELDSASDFDDFDYDAASNFD